MSKPTTEDIRAHDQISRGGPENLGSREMPMNDAVHVDTAPLRRCCRFVCVAAALATGALIAAVPHRARAQDSASEDQCRAAVQDAAHFPPLDRTPVLLRVLQPSIEPVPATDGLIHLAHSG